MRALLLLISIVATSVVIAIVSAESATRPGPCGLNLSAPRLGGQLFRTPVGGQAIRRALAGRFARCTLTRRDGSKFASLISDREKRVLGVIFYRRSGALLNSVHTAVAASGPSPASVECGSKSQANIGPHHWQKPWKWWIGVTAPGLAADKVVKAIRNGQSEWTNNINWCGIKDTANPPGTYQGRTPINKVQQDGSSIMAWGPLNNDQDCTGALACTFAWYDENGAPTEADIVFNKAYKWTTTGAKGAYDIQSIAAHEIGHALQFDHVDNTAKDDTTVLMYPYFASDNTTGRKLGRGDALEDNSQY